MKIRSKALYQYLLQANVLDGSEEDVLRARQAYRKEYKRRWKQQKRPRKEIRVELTLRQFETIKDKALRSGMRHTPYARQAVLRTVDADHAIPRRDELLQVLQLVSMAAIAAAKGSKSIQEIATMLGEAEQLMLNIIHNIL
jgi:hypothetical protein